MTRSLVTGGNGYFGELLVRQLRERGDTVRVLDISACSDPIEGVEYVEADIRDAADVRDACEGIEVVYHNVAQVPLSRDLELLETVNVGGTRTLLSACRDRGVAKVVHTSSSAVFGVPASNPVLPSTVPNPQEAYGRSKYTAELLCQEAVRGGQDISIVRPRTIVGHGRLGIFGILFDWIADGSDVFVLGAGSNDYQFVHADDLAALCIAAGTSPGPTVLNGGAADVQTMRQTLEALCEHAATGAGVRSLPIRPTLAAMKALSTLHLAPFAPYHWLMYSKSMWFDIEHAHELVGWTPRWSTNEMFAQSYDWFIANRAVSTEGASHHRSSAKQGALSIAKRIVRVLPNGSSSD